MKRIFLEEIESTNEYVKSRRGLGEDLLVVAKKHTGGKGTKGRSFSSREGGLYLSKLTFYQNFPSADAFLIMQSAAAAVCETLVAFGLQPKIKWPNDVFVNGKKICGILIENAFSGNQIASSVVGIGLNVYNELPEELSEIATTIVQQTGKRFTVEEIENTLVSFLNQENIAEKYARHLGWLGEEVELVVGENKIKAVLLSVDERGGLWAKVDGEKRRFAAAEISLRVR